MNNELKNHIESQLNSTEKFNWITVGGGSINQAFKLQSKFNRYFVKINSTAVFENGFYEEVYGLQFLEKHTSIVPKIMTEGIFNNSVYLVLEWIESGNQSLKFWKNFANQLVNLHQQKGNQFGLEIDNFMGELAQKNTFFDDFSSFFIECRLKPQIQLAFEKRLLQSNHLAHFENLYKQLPNLLPEEKPSAIHGDLWSGNFMCNSKETAVLIDPAVYYGHREIDLAMTTLFGGFSYEFYTTYQEIYPLENGFEERKHVYNLYPLLIHLNLFGKSYLNSIETIVSQF